MQIINFQPVLFIEVHMTLAQLVGETKRWRIDRQVDSLHKAHFTISYGIVHGFVSKLQIRLLKFIRFSPSCSLAVLHADIREAVSPRRAQPQPTRQSFALSEDGNATIVLSPPA